ncbi:MAG: DNA translocase FtsK 4TM domain-containing protein [Muribaculaceae bacterium]|nr:DNA translocase FtsK 4TM domain-containing protein [Muribaculaceae bacterium]
MAKKKEKVKENYNPDISNVIDNEEYRQEQAARKAERNSRLNAWQRMAMFFRNGRIRIAMGIIMLFLGFFLLLSFVSYFTSSGAADQDMVAANGVIENARNPEQIDNAGAAIGAKLSDFLIGGGVGVAAFIIVVWTFTIAYRLLRRSKRVNFFSYTLVTLLSIFTCSMVVGACTLGNQSTFFPLGGAFGHEANKWLLGLVGVYGTFAVNFIILMIWGIVCYNTLKAIWNMIPRQLPTWRHGKNETPTNGNTVSEFLGDSRQETQDSASSSQQHSPLRNQQPVDGRTNPNRTKLANTQSTGDEPAMLNPIEQSTQVSNPHDPTGEYIHYKFPTLDLMEDRRMNTESVDVEEQESNKRRITETLENYGIKIKTIEVHVGPTVTLFEIVPEDGTRVSKIRNLEDDIALSLAALGIRIIAPMPGRGTIGIEVPNRDPQVVPMREVLASKAFQESKAKLPMVLGCTVSNEVFVADLTKMPHLLVAGATGKGKSVGLNAIIASLLYKKGPSELKFVLVDPKRVEFSIYADLEKYFFAVAPGEERAIVTDTDKVVKVLNCLVQEMENRYRVLEEVKLRKVEDYNEKWRRELRNVRDEHGEKMYHYMPYIVCVIDEFADMIMTAGKEVETPIVRIAQKARAVGIHMIIATQRPSANVITGLIKSNFPGRIAFAVTQGNDSRIILDRGGAQQLIGRGDMLFSVDGEITRLQCPLVDTPDVVRLCEFIKEQEDADKNVDHERPFVLPEYVASADDGGSGADASNIKERDPLFEEAVRWIVQGDTASTSSLQRRYEIGYNRAGRIMDQMEAAGIVGPASGGKPRKVLVTPLDVDQLFT